VEGGGVGATRDGVTDRWAGMRRGALSLAARCGVRQRGEAFDAAVTGGAGGTVHPIRFSNRINFISNGFKFAPKFDS
jgi:hypothetical protein